VPYDSAFGGEVFVTNSDVDWGAERILLNCLDKERSFVDVGANIGYYSVLCMPLVKQVFAFEPDPRILPALESNLSQMSNATLCSYAVSNKSGSMKFALGRDSAVSHLVSKDDVAGDHIVVQTITIDDFASKNDFLMVALKIDVEGHDFQVLLGSASTIQRDQPLILTEFNLGGNTTNNFKNLFNWLSKLEYSIFAFVIADSYVNHPSVWGRRPYKFIELVPETVSKYLFKMLFLVPKHLRNLFKTMSN